MAIVVSIYRGKGLFDIDFTGGVSVQARFSAPQKVGDVRDALEKQPEKVRLPDLAINDVWSTPEQQGLEFIINTSEPDMNVVKRQLTAVFGDKLAHNSVTFTAPAGISVAKKEAPLAEKPSATKAAVSAKSEKTVQGKPEQTPAAFADAYAGGANSTLSFKDAVNHATVEQYVAAAIEAMKLTTQTAALELSNKKYTEGDPTAYKEWTLKTMLSPGQTKSLLTELQQQIAARPDFPASNTIGGAVAENTRYQAVYALIFSWIGIIVFLWVRFQGVAFGLAAVVALVHDVFVMLGAVAISIYLAPFLGFLMIEPVKVNLPIVAAFLTIIGYSVNDTIVVFDRIREVRGKDPALTRKMVNDSTNQTLSRTLLTSFTVFLVVIVLYLAGGEALHGFAFALIVGVATGTYSSVYIAAPILLLLVGKHKEHGA
jgi:SecD/SecF fusion protein